MLNEEQMTEFVEKLRASKIRSDVIELLGIACRQDRHEDPKEIAKTLLEMLEPERLGGIVWVSPWGSCPKSSLIGDEHDWVPTDTGSLCAACGALRS